MKRNLHADDDDARSGKHQELQTSERTIVPRTVIFVLYFMTNIKVKIMKKYTSPSGVELPLKGDILVRKSYSTSGNRDFLE